MKPNREVVHGWSKNNVILLQHVCFKWGVCDERETTRLPKFDSITEMKCYNAPTPRKPFTLTYEKVT